MNYRLVPESFKTPVKIVNNQRHRSFMPFKQYLKTIKFQDDDFVDRLSYFYTSSFLTVSNTLYSLLKGER